MTAFQPLRTNRATTHSALAVLLASTLLASSPALAQTAPPAAEETGPADIIVTATKRSESLQNVAISIQALGSEKLAQQQVKAIDDYVRLLPSVSYQSFGPGQSQLYFRGVSSGGDGLHIGPAPATGLYIDEIPLTTIAGSVDLHVYDIARIEALSGPQGTLFGASSLSGTLRLITNKPNTDKFEGTVDLQVNKFGKGGFGGVAEGMLNFPISDRAALRVVGFYQRDGGYIDNIAATRTFTLDDGDPTTNKVIRNTDTPGLVKNNFNDVITYGGRAALKIDLDDNWTVTPSVIYQHQVAKGAFLFDPKLGKGLKVQDFIPSLNKDRWLQAALTIEGKVGNWDLVYSGGYFTRKVNNEADYSQYSVAYDTYGANADSNYTNFPDGNGGFLDPTQHQILRDKYTKQTHELRVVSPGSDRFRITAGLFFQRQTDAVAANYTIPGLSAIPQTFPNQALAPFPQFEDTVFYSRIQRVDRDYAAFAEATYDLTDTVKLTGGIRGFIAKNTLTGFSGFLRNALNPPFFCIPTQNPILPCVNIASSVLGNPLTQDQSGETHKVSLSWQAAPSKLIYATYSTGFRPGGNNRRPDVIPFKADRLTNFEVGFKTTWLDRKLRINGAVFRENWSNIQFGISPQGANGVTFTYNVGDARIYGAEGDFSLSLGQLTLSGGGAYTDAKLTTDFGPINLQGLPIAGTPDAPRGTRLPIQPRFKGNLTARYAFQLGSIDSFVQGSVSSQSGTRGFLTTAEQLAGGDTKGFTTFDFSMGGKVNNFDVSLFVVNAFDNRGILGLNSACGLTSCLNNARAFPTKPQQFGLKVGTKF